MGKSKVIRYEGKNATVSWDKALCIHIGECGRADNELFVGGRKPWCQPELVSDEAVQDVVMRCPSGALSVEFAGGERRETAPDRNTVNVS